MIVMKNPGTKGRILYLQKYLLEHTDDDHAITTAELLQLYHGNGYKCHRTTIPDDIAALAESGMDIITEQVSRNETATNAYHIGSRLFELAELRMLVDAVSSSRFITAEKSQQLIEKLSRLTNEENRESLTSNIWHLNRLKTTNKNVFVNMDAIRSAIDQQLKISFHYWDYTPQKEKVLRNDGEVYVASPYALIWNDDRYYTAAYSEKHEKVVTYRIDRMCDVKITSEPAIQDKNFNAAVYGRSVIKMFDDGLQEARVSLLVENSLMLKVIDRFGADIETELVNAQVFRAWINVVPSSTFFGWVVQYKGGIIIESPMEVRQSYETFLNDIVDKQSTSNTS